MISISESVSAALQQCRLQERPYSWEALHYLGVREAVVKRKGPVFDAPKCALSSLLKCPHDTGQNIVVLIPVEGSATRHVINAEPVVWFSVTTVQPHIRKEGMLALTECVEVV